MKITMKLILSVLVLALATAFFLTSPYFAELKGIAANHQGTMQLQAESYTGAFKSFSEALQSEPLNFAHHLNLGLNFEILKNEEEALKSYDFIAKNVKDAQIQFYALFNQARLYAQMKNIPEALRLYQEALRVDPNSQEVKINIELLLQQDQQDKSQEKKDEGESDPENKEGENERDQEKPDDQPKNYKKPPQQPKKFESKELSESDVKKILGELERQEQKIRKEFHKQKTKDRPNEKDW